MSKKVRENMYINFLSRIMTIADTKLYLNNDGKLIKLKEPSSRIVIGATYKLINIVIEPIKNDYIDNTKVILENIDTLGYVINHKNEFYKKPLIINFANAFKPGGDVKTKLGAQEEDICRRTNLLKELESYSVNRYYYNNKNESKLLLRTSFERAILSKDISIIIGDDCELLDEPILVDVLTISAPMHIIKPFYKLQLNSTKYGSMRNLIDMIFNVAKHEGYTDIVLGAFGCGAFNNNPRAVSELFKERLEKEHGVFNTVGFPILTTNNKDKNNFKVFNNVLEDNIVCM